MVAMVSIVVEVEGVLYRLMSPTPMSSDEPGPDEILSRWVTMSPTPMSADEPGPDEIIS